MRSNRTLWIAIVVLLGLVVAAGFVIPTLRRPAVSSGAPDGPPQEYELTGIVRDFKKTHPDFAVTASEGNGHYASNVLKWLPGDNKPMFDPAGYKVDGEWHDSSGRPIAPHLANGFPGSQGGETLGIRVDDRIALGNDTRIDAFNSRRGPYGEAGNFGSGAYLSTNSTSPGAVKGDGRARVYGDVYVGPGGNAGSLIDGRIIVTGTKSALSEAWAMPVLSLPEAADMDPNAGEVEIKGRAVTLTGDVDSEDNVDTPAMLFDSLVIKDRAAVTIEGNLVVVTGVFKLEKESQISLLPGATLTVYVTGNDEVKIEKSTINVGNADATTSNVVINYLGTKKIKLKEAHVYAMITAPNGELELDSAHVYGSYVGKSLELKKKGSGFHVDLGTAASGPLNHAITVDRDIKFEDKVEVDSFDSNIGPYDGPDDGGTNYAHTALVMSNMVRKGKIEVKKDTTLYGDVLVGPGRDPGEFVKVDGSSQVTGVRGNLLEFRPIPAVSPPQVGLGKGSDLEYKNGEYTISADVRCKKLKLENATLEVVGDVTIRCEGDVEIKKSSSVNLAEGSTLRLFARKNIKVEDKSKVNMGGNPQHVSIRRMSFGKGQGKFTIKKESAVVAWMQADRSRLKVEDESEFFGSFVGDKIEAKKKSKVHVDMAYLNACLAISDTPGIAGAASSGGITSAETFTQWFRDVPGVNQSAIHKITMTRDATGVYEYLSNDFFPADDRLLGNEGETHNSHFTYTIVADFVYQDCGGQFIELEGGDGAWVYVNGQLVIDLGGTRTATSQYIELDRLGLSGDGTYRIDVFYAQRTSGPRSLKLRTNIVLNTDRHVPTVFSQYD